VVIGAATAVVAGAYMEAPYWEYPPPYMEVIVGAAAYMEVIGAT
jgi:hypothetical protein